MEFLSIFTDSMVLMWVLTLVFAIVCFRCLVYGAMAGTSAGLRVILTVVFAALAYFCWQHASSLHGSNLIDKFVFGAWEDVKMLFHKIF